MPAGGAGVNDPVSPLRQCKASLILVEDNHALREELAHFLKEEGYAVQGVDCGAELNQVLASSQPDILILDLNLPEEDGASIARRIRAAMPQVGIVMLTARVRSIDRLEGYTAGADVFLTKPTRPEELSAVLANLLGRLRRQPHRQDPAGWQIDVKAMALHSPSGAHLALTRAEVILLREMALSGQVAEHGRLMDLLGDESQPEKVNKARVEVLVSRLRGKLEAHAADGLTIRAVRGRGYQLSMPVEVKNLPAPRAWRDDAR
jgi:DNA-binding response OmpR family regulator